MCARRDLIWYEDVIVITADGHENFTDFLPSELNERQKLVGQGGIGVKLQPAAYQALSRRYGAARLG